MYVCRRFLSFRHTDTRRVRRDSRNDAITHTRARDSHSPAIAPAYGTGRGFSVFFFHRYLLYRGRKTLCASSSTATGSCGVTRITGASASESPCRTSSVDTTRDVRHTERRKKKIKVFRSPRPDGKPTLGTRRDRPTAKHVTTRAHVLSLPVGVFHFFRAVIPSHGHLVVADARKTRSARGRRRISGAQRYGL